MVSETRGTAQVPASGTTPTTMQDSDPGGKPPQINELEESERQDFSQLLEDLKIPVNKLLQAHPQVQKKLKNLAASVPGHLQSKYTWMHRPSRIKLGAETWHSAH